MEIFIIKKGPAYKSWYKNGQLNYEIFYIEGVKISKILFENQ